MIKYKTDNETLVFKNITGSELSEEGSGDRIELMKNYVQNLNKNTALESAKNCSNVRGFTVFVLGGVLQVIRDNGWFNAYGYQSFKAMVEEDIGLSQSTAYDYIKIYSCLSESGVSWNQIKHIGWTKIRWFAKHLTQDNVKQWIQEAEGKNVQQLKEFVKQETDSAASKAVLPKYDPASIAEESTQVDTVLHDTATTDGNVEETVKPPLVTETSALETAHIRQFKLYPEQEVVVNQALDHVKAELQTEHNGVALEGVCLAYLRDCI